MLLTISTTHQPATDLGYVLHKNPERAHRFDLQFGAVHVLYPEAGRPDRCTAALLVEDWAGAMAARHGYTVELSGIGPDDAECGAPTQMAVFRR